MAGDEQALAMGGNMTDPPISARSLWWTTANGRTKIAAASRARQERIPSQMRTRSGVDFLPGIKQGFYVLAAHDMIAFGVGLNHGKNMEHTVREDRES